MPKAPGNGANDKNMQPLYSIGHGHKTEQAFINELRSFNVKFLIDVRSNPYSKWSPEFNRGEIESWLRAAGIVYAYWGDSIGGKPQSDDCYDEGGYFDYKAMAEKPLFKASLKRLIAAAKKDYSIALMCTETDPSQCHRSKLIGRELYFGFGINMKHITGSGKSVTQEDIMQHLTNNIWQPANTLFGPCEQPYFKSVKSYKDLKTEAIGAYD